MEPVRSMFDLYNRKETGLSRSLAAIIYKDYRVLKKILKNKNLSFNSIDQKSLEVYYELTSERNRFDILCKSENYVIIVETKIGYSTVNDDQRKRYINVLKKYDKKQKVLIQITQFDNQKDTDDGDIKIINVLWLDILKIIKNCQITIDLSDEFDNYIKRSHNMKITDIDIWAVVVRKREMKRFREDNIYLNTKYHQPIFIGLREWDNNLKKTVVKELYPVKEVLPSNSPLLKKYKDFPDNNSWVYFMDKPIVLKNHIPKDFKGIRKSAVQIKFSEIGDI